MSQKLKILKFTGTPPKKNGKSAAHLQSIKNISTIQALKFSYNYTSIKLYGNLAKGKSPAIAI